jgi:hypothetical protein
MPGAGGLFGTAVPVMWNCAASGFMAWRNGDRLCDGWKVFWRAWARCKPRGHPSVVGRLWQAAP